MIACQKLYDWNEVKARSVLGVVDVVDVEETKDLGGN